MFALTDSTIPRRYWADLKRKLTDEGFVQLYEKIGQLKLESPDGYIKDMHRRDPELSKGWGQIAIPLSVDTAGGKQKANCANTEGIFRISPEPHFLSVL